MSARVPDRYASAARIAFRAIAGLSLALLSAVAGGQTGPIVLSIDQVRTGGEVRHEMLPLAEFDGIRFRPVREPDSPPGASSSRQRLLDNYRRVQVLHRGRRVGVVEIADIRTQQRLFCSLTVGSGTYVADTDLPASEITHSVRAFENGERSDYTYQVYLAFAGESGESGELRADGQPLVTDVTDPVELQRYALDVARFAPRPELAPLGVDATRAYRFDRHNAVLVVRDRRSAGTVVGPAGSEIEPPLYTDIVIVRAGAGQGAVLPLSGASTEANAFNPGANARFVDAFELANGTVYLAFAHGSSATVTLRLYKLGAISDTRLVFETDYGC